MKNLQEHSHGNYKHQKRIQNKNRTKAYTGHSLREPAISNITVNQKEEAEEDKEADTESSKLDQRLCRLQLL